MTQITIEHLDAALKSVMIHPDGKYSVVDVFNKAQELAEGLGLQVGYACSANCNEQATQDQFISAEQARALGAGNAEFHATGWASWHICGETCNYFDGYQYRAIRKEVPAEPLNELETKLAEALQTIFVLVEPHAELKALYAQQVTDGTLDDFVWEFLNEAGDYQHCFSAMDGIASEPLWFAHKKYRCTLQPTCQVKNLDTGELKTMTREAAQKLQAETHAKWKALYAQQVKNGTLDDFVWEASALPNKWTDIGVPDWSLNLQYRCTLKPTCQVRNDDTGELKTMTQEAAKLLQAETKDVCDWFLNGATDLSCGFLFENSGIYSYKLKANLVKLDGKLVTREAAIAIWESKKDTCDVWFKSPIGVWVLTEGNDCAFLWTAKDGEYQLRPKAKKQVSWTDMPVGVMTNKGEFRGAYTNAQGILRLDIEVPGNLGRGVDSHPMFASDVELAPADQQPWIAAQEDGTALHEGLSYVKRWSGEDDCQLLAFKVIGIADGWKLKSQEVEK